MLTEVYFFKQGLLIAGAAYQTSAGKKVPIQFGSPEMNRFLNFTALQVQRLLGISPSPIASLSKSQRHKLYRVWLDVVAPTFETLAYSSYADISSQVSKQALDNQINIFNVVDLKGCVCRELSILASVFFGQYGLSSKFVRGTANSSDGRSRRGYAWTQIYAADAEGAETLWNSDDLLRLYHDWLIEWRSKKLSPAIPMEFLTSMHIAEF